jgi:hypothetical protein
MGWKNGPTLSAERTLLRGDARSVAGHGQRSAGLGRVGRGLGHQARECGGARRHSGVRRRAGDGARSPEVRTPGLERLEVPGRARAEEQRRCHEGNYALRFILEGARAQKARGVEDQGPQQLR